jgi:hypothetical protein
MKSRSISARLKEPGVLPNPKKRFHPGRPFLLAIIAGLFLFLLNLGGYTGPGGAFHSARGANEAVIIGLETFFWMFAVFYILNIVTEGGLYRSPRMPKSGSVNLKK